MKDFTDVLTDQNLESSYLALEAIYKDQLGIQIQLNNEEEPFFLVKPKQLSSNKLRLSEMNSMLQEAFIKQIKQLNTNELLILQETLELLRTPELEGLEFEYDSLKTKLIDQYGQVLKSTLADYLNSHLVTARQSPKVKETISHLDRFLQFKTADKQYKEIQSFYKKELGIRIKEVSMGDEMGSAPYVADNYKKINQHAIQVDRSTQTTMLGTEDLDNILSQYYKPIIATLTLSELFHYTKQTKALLDAMPDFSEHEDYQVLRYLNPLYQTIKQQLLTRVQPLLEPGQTLQIGDLALIIVNIDQIPDTGESVEPYFEKLTHCTITTDIAAIKACDLSTYIDARNLIVQHSDFDHENMVTALDNAITARLLIFLQDYKQDVSTHRTDYNKSKKLASIDKMLTQVQSKELSTEELLTEVQAIFLKDSAIHKSEPFGRYLYHCICAFFKLKIESTNYQGKLFDTLKPELNTSGKRPAPTSGADNKSEEANDDKAPLLKRNRSGSI